MSINKSGKDYFFLGVNDFQIDFFFGCFENFWPNVVGLSDVFYYAILKQHPAVFNNLRRRNHRPVAQQSKHNCLRFNFSVMSKT